MTKRLLGLALACFIVPISVTALDLSYTADTGTQKWDDSSLNSDSGRSQSFMTVSGTLFEDSTTHFWYSGNVSGSYHDTHSGDGDSDNSLDVFLNGSTTSSLSLSGKTIQPFSLVPFVVGGVNQFPTKIELSLFAELTFKDFTDIFGHHDTIHKSKTVDVIGELDNTPPSFTLTSNFDDSWSKVSENVVVQLAQVVETQSGLAGASYRFDGGDWITVTASDPVFSSGIQHTFGDGVHTLDVKLTDNVGNESAVQTRMFRVDTAPPSAPVPSLSLSSDGAPPHVSTLTATWTASSDTASGVRQYEVFWDPGTGTEAASVIVPASVTSASIPVAYRGPVPYSVRVAALDNAGNETSSAAVPLTVPEALTFGGSPAVSSDASGGYRIALVLSVTPVQLSQYGSVVFQRQSADPANPLPDALVSTPFSFATADIVGPSGSLLDSRWSTDSSGRLVFTDAIPAGTGAAHKTVRYAVSATIAGAADSGAASASALLPNHPGTVTVRILDMAGRVSTAPDFQLFADGKAQLSIQGSDVDLDHWDLEADRVLTAGSPSAQLTSLKKLSGQAAVPYDPAAGAYPELCIPITLTPGITNVEAFWQEAKDGASSYHSDIESITATLNPDTGLYSITVTDGYANPANSDSVGVVTRPGEPLQFTIQAPGLSDSQIQWQWDADNASDVAYGASPPAHAYGQKPGQTGDTAQYTLTVTLALPTPVQTHMTVTVQDTQEGTLFKSETWHGTHTVTGIVVVPQGLTLTVGGDIVFEGGLGGGFGQGLDVRGALSVADGVVLAPLSGQSQNWGTVLVEGTAWFGAAEVRGAQQAVSVPAGGTLTLAGTKLRANRTGLHVVGGTPPPLVTITGAEISGNTLYGIKEDAGGRPALSGTAVTGNAYNYYSFDQGLLTIDQINQLNAAPDNTGDAAQGTQE